ncbi:MAG: ZIP family metal transporter [Erysipelotrichaceae bacterium]|jgi:ZIP family zinc transporter|nr:ZIP family metal transporter [Erysipelotrichaceae bacterium]
MIELIIFGLLSGVGGMVLGAIIPLLFKNVSDEFNRLLTVFAAGIMLAVTIFDLFPEAFIVVREVMEVKHDIHLVLYVFGFALISMIILFGLTTLIKIMAKKRQNLLPQKNHKYYLTGIILMLSIALHDLPEGVAIGVSYSLQASKGLSMAILIGIHNIPEGFASALPFKRAGMKRHKIVLLCGLVGLVTLVGAIAGYYLGQIDPYVDSALLALTAGAMLYLVFDMFKDGFAGKRKSLLAFTTIMAIFLGIFIISVVSGV